MQNFFAIFDISPSFDIDLADLEKRYFALQRVCHPDRFIGKAQAERQQAILRSMQANEAYEALKQPLTRARHLLALQGIHVGSEKDSVKPSQALLIEIMELREALEQATTFAQYGKIAEENLHAVTSHIASLSADFAAQHWQQAAQTTIALGYFLKIHDEITTRLKKLTTDCF